MLVFHDNNVYLFMSLRRVFFGLITATVPSWVLTGSSYRRGMLGTALTTASILALILLSCCRLVSCFII